MNRLPLRECGSNSDEHDEIGDEQREKAEAGDSWIPASLPEGVLDPTGPEGIEQVAGNLGSVAAESRPENHAPGGLLVLRVPDSIEREPEPVTEGQADDRCNRAR